MFEIAVRIGQFTNLVQMDIVGRTRDQAITALWVIFPNAKWIR